MSTSIEIQHTASPVSIELGVAIRGPKGDVGDVNPEMLTILEAAEDARDQAQDAAESAAASAASFAINYTSMATQLIRTQAVIASHHAFN